MKQLKRCYIVFMDAVKMTDAHGCDVSSSSLVGLFPLCKTTLFSFSRLLESYG